MRRSDLSNLGSALLLAALAPLITTSCRRNVTPPPEFQPPVFVPPLSDAQIGERLVTRRGAEEWEYTVVSAGAKDVVVEIVKRVEGAPQGVQRLTWNRNRFGLPEPDVVRRIEAARIEVGGRAWDCWMLLADNRERGQFVYWLSDEVAVHGVLKIARLGEGGVEESTSIEWVADTLTGADARTGASAERPEQESDEDK